MKRIAKTCLDIIKANPDFIIFLFLGASIWFFQTITHVKWSFDWFFTIDPWITSFIITFLTYSILDMVFGRLSFFQKHKYLFMAISFLASTFLGESLTYELMETIETRIWVVASVEYVLSFVILFLCCLFGLWAGAERGKIKAKRAMDDYYKQIKEMPKESKKELIKLCKKALKVDDETIHLILSLKKRKQ